MKLEDLKDLTVEELLGLLSLKLFEEKFESTRIEYLSESEVSITVGDHHKDLILGNEPIFQDLL